VPGKRCAKTNFFRLVTHGPVAVCFKHAELIMSTLRTEEPKESRRSIYGPVLYKHS
jgi:hypothetical protein